MIFEQKNKFREYYKNVLNNIQDREEKEIAANENLINIIDTYDYKKIAIFLSFKNEISTEMLHMFLLSENKEIYAPKIVNNSLEFGKLSFDTNLIINNFGIPEPSISQPIFDFDVIITPFLAFDEKKYRLGYGKGYYDKYFTKYNGFKIGFGFSDQYTKSLPTLDTDIPLDLIVTDKFIF